MNRCVVVAIFLWAAASYVQSHVPDISGIFVDGARCKCLAPTAAEGELLHGAARGCVAEQRLEAFILALRDLGGLVVENEDDAVLMEVTGYPKLATALRKCIVRRTNMLKADGTIDMEALKTSISNKVTGLPAEAYTRLGLENCPDVEEYDVAEYMQCVGTYCATGGPPYKRLQLVPCCK